MSAKAFLAFAWCVCPVGTDFPLGKEINWKCLECEGKECWYKTKAYSLNIQGIFAVYYFSKIISEIHAFKIQLKQKQGFEVVKEKEQHVPELLPKQEVRLWQKEETGKSVQRKITLQGSIWGQIGNIRIRYCFCMNISRRITRTCRCEICFIYQGNTRSL